MQSKIFEIEGRQHEVTFTAMAECNDCGAKAHAATTAGAASLLKHGPHYDSLPRRQRERLLGIYEDAS